MRTFGWAGPTDDVAAGLLVITVLSAVAVALRWQRFSRGLGAFRCFVWLPGSDGAFSKWRRGAARFDRNALRWFPVYTLLTSRSLVFDREQLQLSDRRWSTQDDAVPEGLVVLCGSIRGRSVELAVPKATAAALVLWVESGPPGRNVNVA